MNERKYICTLCKSQAVLEDGESQIEEEVLGCLRRWGWQRLISWDFEHALICPICVEKWMWTAYRIIIKSKEAGIPIAKLKAYLGV